MCVMPYDFASSFAWLCPSVACVCKALCIYCCWCSAASRHFTAKNTPDMRSSQVCVYVCARTGVPKRACARARMMPSCVRPVHMRAGRMSARGPCAYARAVCICRAGRVYPRAMCVRADRVYARRVYVSGLCVRARPCACAWAVCMGASRAGRARARARACSPCVQGGLGAGGT